MFADIPFVLAFTGGLVATVNPCGFAMLPAYLSFFLGLGESDEPPDRAVAILRALRVGITVVAGFVLVFGVAGFLLTVGTRAIANVIPWAALLVGAGILVLGVWLLSGRVLPVHLPTPGRAGSGRNSSALFMFGLAYAVASLSCTLPVFLAVVAGTATRQSVGSALAVYGVYAIGMALPLLALTVALAVGHGTLVHRLRSFGRHASRFSGVLLVLAGVYILLFWATALTGLQVGPANALLVLVEGWSSTLTTLIGERPLLWGTIFALVVVAAIVLARRARGRQAEPDPEPAEKDPETPVRG